MTALAFTLRKATAPRGAGHWVTMHGAHVWIDADGQPQWTGTKTKPDTRWRFGPQLHGKAKTKGAKPTVPVRGDIQSRPVPAHVVRWERARAAGPNGRLFATREAHVLDVAHRLDHGRFKTKDFRTRLGTHTAQDLVASMPAPKSERAYKRAVNAVGDAVAEKLGNTRAVALAKYIAPQVFEPWRGGAGV